MQVFEQAWRNIVCPTQIKSKLSAYGPRERLIDGHAVQRIDLTVTNRNGKKLQGYVFHCPDRQAQQTVLYLHGNGGSKLEALPLADLIPHFGINLAAFDLPGCGNSDPQNLTYGVYEVFDIRDMLQEIRKHVKVGRVVLWGRSMGSLCAIMFTDMYAYEVSGLVLDSPFRSLGEVVERIANRKVSLPSFILSPLLYMVKQRATKEVGFDLFSIDYLSVFKKLNSHLPVLFVFSNFDAIVPARQVLDFFNVYKGPKDLCQIYRTHDQDRPQDLFRQGMMWLTRNKKKNMNAIFQAREWLHEQREEKRQEVQRSKSQGNFLCKRSQARPKKGLTPSSKFC